jgi:hypothetical protein
MHRHPLVSASSLTTQGLSALTVWGKPPTVKRANGSGGSGSGDGGTSLAALIRQQDALLAAATAQVGSSRKGHCHATP